MYSVTIRFVSRVRLSVLKKRKKKKKFIYRYECHCYTDRITDRWYSVKKIAGYIDNLDHYDETNYPNVLFTADGYN